MKKGNLIKGYCFVILSAFLYGCMPMITTYIYAEGVNRESVVLLRNLLSLPALALAAWGQSRSFKIPLKSLPSISVIALMGCCVTPLLLYASYPTIGTGTATVFRFVYPAVVVLMGLIFLKKKAGKGVIGAMLLCVLGICLFYNPNDPLDWAGCGLALASGVTYAAYVVMLSGFRYKEVAGFKLSFYVSAVCSVVMLVVCLATGCLTLPATVMGWILCILLAILVNVGALAAFQMGTFIIGGERASILSTVEPLTGVVMGVLVFNEIMAPFAYLGVVFVLAACILIAVMDSQKK